jgi:surface protein
MDILFALCSSLVSIDLSNFNTEKVLKMNRIFYNCGNLSYIDISNFTITTEYNELFEGIAKNGEIKIKKGIRDKLNISDLLWTITEI